MIRSGNHLARASLGRAGASLLTGRASNVRSHLTTKAGGTSGHKPPEFFSSRVKNTLVLLGLGGVTIGLPLGLQMSSHYKPDIKGSHIEPGNFVFDDDQFETVGDKSRGRAPGSIIRLKGEDDYYVKKSVPNEKALWEELLSALFIREAMGKEDAPKNIIIQTPADDGSVNYEIASRIMGEGRIDQEPGVDLEWLFSQYNYESELKQHPIANHGVSLMLDSVLGKGIDTKSANFVAFRKAEGNSSVYPIDHEQAQVTSNRSRPVVITTDPKELVDTLNDLNPEKARSTRDRASAGIDGAEAELQNAKDNMPLFGTPAATNIYNYLLNDLINNEDEHYRMLAVISQIGALTDDEINTMIDRHPDLQELLPEEIKDKFKSFLADAKTSCANCMKDSKDFPPNRKAL